MVMSREEAGTGMKERVTAQLFQGCAPGASAPRREGTRRLPRGTQGWSWRQAPATTHRKRTQINTSKNEAAHGAAKCY